MSKRMFEEEHMAPRPCADGSYVQTGGTQGSIPGSPNMYCAGHAPGVGLAFDSIQVVVDDAQRYNIGDMKRVCPPPSDSVIEARFLVKKAEIGVIIGHKGTHISEIRARSQGVCSILTVPDKYQNLADRVLVIRAPSRDGLNAAVSCLVYHLSAYSPTFIAPRTGPSTDPAPAPPGALALLRVLVPCPCVGAILGHAGALARDTAAATGARLTVSPHPLPASTEKTVVLSGRPAAVAAAFARVFGQMLALPGAGKAAGGRVRFVPYDPVTAAAVTPHHPYQLHQAATQATVHPQPAAAQTTAAPQAAAQQAAATQAAVSQAATQTTAAAPVGSQRQQQQQQQQQEHEQTWAPPLQPLSAPSDAAVNALAAATAAAGGYALPLPPLLLRLPRIPLRPLSPAPASAAVVEADASASAGASALASACNASGSLNDSGFGGDSNFGGSAGFGDGAPASAPITAAAAASGAVGGYEWRASAQHHQQSYEQQQQQQQQVRVYVHRSASAHAADSGSNTDTDAQHQQHLQLPGPGLESFVFAPTVMPVSPRVSYRTPLLLRAASPTVAATSASDAAAVAAVAAAAPVGAALGVPSPLPLPLPEPALPLPLPLPLPASTAAEAAGPIASVTALAAAAVTTATAASGPASAAAASVELYIPCARSGRLTRHSGDAVRIIRARTDTRIEVKTGNVTLSRAPEPLSPALGGLGGLGEERRPAPADADMPARAAVSPETISGALGTEESRLGEETPVLGSRGGLRMPQCAGRVVRWCTVSVEGPVRGVSAAVRLISQVIEE